MIMPKMSGRELAKRVRQLHPEAKIVFMSGHSEDLIDEPYAVTERDAFIQKPFPPAALARLLRGLLDQKAGQPKNA
jgi:two-component system cell cycle sensor histidine kinase/response regulator CckA